MFQPFGLIVHGVDVQAERLREIQLEQTMVPDDFERYALARGSERDAAIRLVHSELERRELLHHRAGGGGRDTLAFRQRGDGDAAAVGGELVDLAQVVLDRVG